MALYALSSSYYGQTLIDGFNFINTPDPNNGFVAYQDYASASAAGLVSINSDTNAVYLGIDTTNIYNPDGSQGGRPSTRIESKVPVNQGLVIGDFAHMPGSICGGWPAFWMYGPNWPSSGEVDIIEGANMAYTNEISAHTTNGCLLPDSTEGLATGIPLGTNCSIDTNAGCNYAPPATDMTSYGDDFNAVGGGVYALQWTDETIKVWHFTRGGIPQDIIDKVPLPDTWGTPQALFGTDSCDIDSHFMNMNIVLNIDLCGTYTNILWDDNNQCNSFADTCEEWVGNNPSMLTDLYWEVNYIDVYDAIAPPTDDPTPLPTDVPTPLPTDVPTDVPSVAPIVLPSIVPTSLNGSLSLPAGPVGPSPVGPSPAGPSRAAGSPSAAVANPSSANRGPSASSTRSTAPSSAPSPIDSIVPVHNPAAYNGFAYLGCFGSTMGFSTFDLGGQDPALTIQKCINLCGTKRYAGAVDSTCYCANNLDAGTNAVRDRSRCNTPCPGNTTQFCGRKSASLSRVTLPSDVLLTMYTNLGAASSNVTTPVPAPALGGSVGAGAAVGPVQTVTITYTTICSTNPAQLVTITTCSPFTPCATASTPPPVAYTTVTQSCAACGQNGSSVVTLTIPKAVIIANVTRTAATATPPVATSTFLPVLAGASEARDMSALAVVVAMAGFLFA